MKEKIKDFLSDLPFICDMVEGKPRVNVLRMAGVIADSSQMRRAGINFEKMKKPIEKAFEGNILKAVALIINSPGGAPTQCALIADKIRKLSEEKDTPVFAFVEDVAASGGYWLACAGEEIYAQSTSIVGSIGVIYAGFGLEDFIKRYDIKRRIHTAGKDKSFLDPFREEKSDDVARLKELQENMHDSFKTWVHERRAGKLTGSDDQLMEGAFWTGDDALGLGIIDGIGDVVSIMREKLGDNVRFVDIETEKKSLLAQLPLSEVKEGNIVMNTLDAFEARGMWGRFGL